MRLSYSTNKMSHKYEYIFIGILIAWENNMFPTEQYGDHKPRWSWNLWGPPPGSQSHPRPQTWRTPGPAPAWPSGYSPSTQPVTERNSTYSLKYREIVTAWPAPPTLPVTESIVWITISMMNFHIFCFFSGCPFLCFNFKIGTNILYLAISFIQFYHWWLYNNL